MHSPSLPPEPIAVIGIGCRFPGGADTPDKFWKLLVDGVDAVAEIPADRFDLSRLFDANPAAAGRIYTRWGGFLDNIDQFDAAFFGISPREAMRVDPQHRLLLETSWEALEDAGIPADAVAGEAVGVFVGISTHDYGDIQMYPVNRTRLDHHSNTGTAVSIAANRVSYFFDFRGPSLAVDTACSSALTAVHLAVNSLRSGECRMALAGGVHIMLTPEPTMGFCRATMLSPTGRCRAFDSAADGYVRSEGAGVVLLKPLSAARADGDAVYAVLRSTVINQDGKSASGLTVPSSASHQSMLQRALSSAGLSARDIQYVEAHGTGTPVGDPVEASALGAVLGRGRDAHSACVIGSVKTNIGHLEAASGIAGLVKTVLALSHREIPRSLHFNEPNPAIDFDALGLRVAAEHQPWPAPAALAAAGVNSFGFGGANAHAVLAEPPADTRRRHGRVSVEPQAASPGRAQVLPLSARSSTTLRALAREYAQRLRTGDADAAVICGAAAHTRASHPHRLAIIGATADELADGLDAYLAGDSRANVISGKAPASPAAVAFAFSGMGPQWWGMARALIRDEPIVRETIERCDRALGPHSGWSIVTELAADEPVSRLREVEIAQTCGFAVQIALVELLKSWGVTPAAVFGHSAGELAAAYVAGAHDFDQLVLLVYHRSRLQARRSGYGRMLAAGVPAESVESLLAGRDGVALAAVNGPASVTLSGDSAQLEAIAADLQQRSLFARLLPVDVPFHSAAMDPIRAELAQSIASLESRTLTVPMVSTVTGQWIEGAQLNPDYWWANVRQPVMFAAGTETLLQHAYSVFVEIGPHPVLAVSLRECVSGAGAAATVLATLRRDSDDRLNLLRTIAGLYVEGVSPDWSKIVAKPAAHVRLPLYQWDRARHWFEPASSASWQIDQPSSDDTGHPLLQRRLRAALPAWETPLAHADLGWVQDHLVQGAVVFPAAGYLEAAIAASLAPGRDAVRLSRVAISRALVVSGEAQQLQVALDKDGSRFRIFSAASGGEWVRHAAGEIGSEHASDLVIDRDELVLRCTIAVPRDDFYANMAARGLQYGEAFKGLQEMWRGDDEALARIDSGGSPAIDLERYRLHPALLDAALQLLFVASPAAGDEAPPLYLPIAVDELRSYGHAGGSLWAHARVRQARAGRVVGDVRVFDANGLLRCEIRGLTCQRVDARAGANGDSEWFYSYDWEPAIPDVPPATPERRVFAEDAVDALADLRPRIDALAIEQNHRDYYDAERALDRLAAAYSAAALAEAEGRIAPERQLLADRLMLRERQRAPADASTLLDRFVNEHPAYGIEAALLQRAGAVLGRNLRGDWASVEELFSGAGAELLEQFYLSAASMAFANHALTETVRALAAHSASTGPLRILEIGGGTGGSTPFVLAGIEPLPVEYTFSDVSPEFVRRAAERWGDRRGMRTRVLDVERGPEPADVAQFDLVVAANVVHATTDVAATLANLRRFLAPGGALVLLEITRRAEWLDIVFGQTRGWWKAADGRRADGYPLLSLDAWRGALDDAGFVRSVALADSPPDGEPAQSILIALAPIAAEHPRGDWRVIADDQHVQDVLQRGLAQAGRNGVMFVATSAPAPSDTDAWLDHQASVAASVLALAQQLRDADLWIVTTDSVDHAALWGLGRNLMLETRAVRCRLVEVESLSSENLDVVCRVVAGEFLELADEEELRITPRSIEVRRMQRLDVNAAPLRELRRGEEADGQAVQWRAEIDVAGSLESIAFRAATIPPPRPHDISVRVDAASLNFRDVMLAMGMIPELESESSFGEQQLGLDAAGVVTACGSAVAGLRPGDRVVAIVPGAFASAATTRAALAARCPDNLSIEDAAAVPCAFATAQYALTHLARLAPGERVLIHSATGGVGLAAVQIAQRAGAEIFATAGSDDKRAYLRQLGVAHVMDSRSLRFADEILEITGGAGVDVVLNSLTGEALARSLSLLRPSGRFIEIGKRDIYQNNDLGLLAFRKNLSFFAVDLDRLCAERPQLIAQLLGEVMAGFEEGTLRPLPRRAFPMRELEAALRVMGQAKHIGKLVLLADQPPLAASRQEKEQAQPLRADATYLVTGGVSGFGAVVAHWMSQHGARHLVPLSRRGEEGADADLIADMRAAGARVEVMACDVTKRRDVDAVLARIREQLPPLAGVFHAAMVLDDAPPEEMTVERFKTVMAPKMLGARHLDEATRESDLDHFVLFGSIAGIFGNDLQANYCAANAYLDSLAARRRRDGRPALVIDWGVLGDAGYVSRNAGVLDFLARHGYLAFNRDEAMRVLEKGLSRDVTRLIAAKIDWRHWADALPGRAASPRTRHLVPRAGAASATRSDWSRRIAGAATAAERLAEIESYLRQRLGRILGAPNAAIEDETPLAQLGTDSLTGVELTTAIGIDLGVEIPLVRVLQGATLRGLALLIAEKMPAPSSDNGSPARPAPPAPTIESAAPLAGSAPAPAIAAQAEASPVTAHVAEPQMTAPRSLSAGRRRRALARSVVGYAFNTVSTIEIEGRDHLPAAGPYILAVNHLSALDVPLVMSVLPHDATLLAADYLQRSALIDRLLRTFGSVIYVARGEGDRGALEQSVSVLARGGVIALGPEGTRSATAVLGTGHTGVAWIAAASGAPVVPLAAWGQERLAASLKSLRRGSVRVRIGAPLPAPPRTAGAGPLRSYTDEVMRALAALLPDEYRGAYAATVTRSEA